MIDRYIPESPFWRGVISVLLAMGAIGAVVGFAFLMVSYPAVWLSVMVVGVIFVISIGFYDFLTHRRDVGEVKAWWENRWTRSDD